MAIGYAREKTDDNEEADRVMLQEVHIITTRRMRR
jgi:hypothetical protein